jgi:hypothetical protein
MNHVFDPYRGRFKIDTPEKYGIEFMAKATDLRGGGRPATAAEGAPHPEGPGQGSPSVSFDGGGETCTTVPAAERPKEQAGLVSTDEWRV